MSAVRLDRCPAGQETRVYHRRYERLQLRPYMDKIAYHPPRTIARTTT